MVVHFFENNINAATVWRVSGSEISSNEQKSLVAESGSHYWSCINFYCNYGLDIALGNPPNESGDGTSNLPGHTRPLPAKHLRWFFFNTLNSKS